LRSRTVDLDPWGGETWRSSNQTFQPHRYTTYERDANGGDDAMMRRYQSYWNRFSQPDPYDGSYNLNDPQSFNRYSYVHNDPVNFIDPSGLLCISYWELVTKFYTATGQIISQTLEYEWSWCESNGNWTKIIERHPKPLKENNPDAARVNKVNQIYKNPKLGSGLRSCDS